MISSLHYTEHFKTQLTQAQSILLIFDAQNASLDYAAAATSFFLALQKNLSAEKKIQLFSPSEPIVEQISLVGIDKTATKLSSTRTLITLDQTNSQVEQIFCETDPQTQCVQIFILSKKQALIPQQIKIQPLAPEFDLLISFGITDLKKIKSAGLANIDPQKMIVFSVLAPISSKIKPINPLRDSFCEMVVAILRQWAWSIDADIATNLLLGLDSFTENFSQEKTSAHFFEAAGWLLRSGGERTLPAIQHRQEQYFSAAAKERSADNLAKKSSHKKVISHFPKENMSPVPQSVRKPQLANTDSSKVRN